MESEDDRCVFINNCLARSQTISSMRTSVGPQSLILTGLCLDALGRFRLVKFFSFVEEMNKIVKKHSMRNDDRSMLLITESNNNTSEHLSQVHIHYC